MEFVRGDTFPFKFKLTMSDGSNVATSDIDTLLVTCRQSTYKESPILFQKTLNDVIIEDGFCHVVFDPQDTEDLMYGNYYFDVEVTLKSGYRKTKLFEFDLTEETTIHESVVE